MNDKNQIPVRPESRNKVYDVLDGERDYQDDGEGNAKRHPGQPPMTPGEFILCMELTLAKARMAWYHPDGGEACMHYIRKTSALGIGAMELHGAPPREYHVPASAGITGEMHATAALDFLDPDAKPDFAAQSAAADTLAGSDAIAESVALAEPLPSTPVPAVPNTSS